MLRVDPEGVVVVASRRALEELERLAAIFRAADRLSRHVDGVAIPGIDRDAVHVARREAGRRVDAGPARARVVRTVETPRAGPLGRGGNVGQGPDAAASRSGQSDSAQIARRKSAAADPRPRQASVGGLVDAAARTAGRLEVGEPRIVSRLPERGVDDRRVVRIRRQVGASRLFVDEEDVGPCLPAVLGAKDSSLLVRTEDVAQRRHQDHVGIAGVDEDPSNGASRGESQVFPALAAVVRAKHAVSGGDVVARLDLAGADVDHVRIRRRDRDRADRRRGLPVEDRNPGPARVFRLPDASRGGAEVIRGGRVRDALGAGRPAAAKRPDQPPAHVGIERGIEGLCEGGADSEQPEQTDNDRLLHAYSPRRLHCVPGSAFGTGERLARMRARPRPWPLAPLRLPQRKSFRSPGLAKLGRVANQWSILAAPVFARTIARPPLARGAVTIARIANSLPTKEGGGSRRGSPQRSRSNATREGDVHFE